MESAQLDPYTVRTRLNLARGLLQRRHQPEPVWPVIASAFFFMICALGFATALISSPSPTFARPPKPAAAPASFTPVIEDAKPLPKNAL